MAIVAAVIRVRSLARVERQDLGQGEVWEVMVPLNKYQSVSGTTSPMLNSPSRSTPIPKAPNFTFDLLLRMSDNFNPSIIGFTQGTDQQLADLATPCRPTTFSIAQNNALDKPYRKAGKMDASNSWRGSLHNPRANQRNHQG